jgi:3'(2'), 5'-bisphosphate nucleotidase
VTVADYSAQAVISYILQTAFPDTKLSLIGEEDSGDLRNQPVTLAAVVETVNEALNSPSAQIGPLVSVGGVTLTPEQVCEAIDAGASMGGREGRHWILDPVDGTYGFVQGDQYAVALAMLDDGELVVGALGCPNLPTRTEFLAYAHRYHRLLKRLFPPPDDTLWDKGCMFLAQRGCGCTVEPVGDSHVVAQNIAPVPVKMSKRGPEEATFCEPVRKGVSNQGRNATIADLMGVKAKPLRLYSQVKYGALARGDADIFMKFPKSTYKEKVWDHAAGVIVVEEAGGVCTDAAGRPLDFAEGRLLDSCDRGIVAASDTLHTDLVRAVAMSFDSAML